MDPTKKTVAAKVSKMFYSSLSLLLVVGFIVLFGYALRLIRDQFAGEQEGTVKIDDCRSTVNLKEGSRPTWFKTFTCDYKRTEKGNILGGTCVSVVTEGATCQTVYIYEKKPQVRCPDPKYPYPGTDDKCHSEYQIW